MRIVLLIAFTLLLSSFTSAAQNLPSLILNRNINATFSIIAYDTAAREWGIAVATNNIYVGNSTCYLQPGTGAFSVIAETEPAYGLNGLLQLQQGKTIEQAIRYTRDRDSLADYRQVAGIDSTGNVFAFTGISLRNWKGVNTHLTGKHFAVMGNQLAPGTLPAMAAAFENTSGTLATRLLAAICAGEKAGGQITGKQSAALVVKGAANEWYNQIDLRVDHSSTPFSDLVRLLQYHYGRITLNQALYALNNQQTERGKNLLQKAITQTEGWYGIYSRIAKAWLLLNDTLQAIHTLKTAMAAEPRWQENLPAFYCLYAKEKSFAALYPESNFTIADWNNAISMLSALRQPEKATLLAQQITRQYPSSSYTWYLLASAWQQLGQLGKAMQANTRALQNDPENADALRLKALLALDLKKS
jgi:uncharacterized Ntn-hydrolase superfamily protein